MSGGFGGSAEQAESSTQLFGPQADLFSQLLGQAGGLAGQGLAPGGALQQQGQGFLDVLSQFSQQGNPFLQGQIDILGQNIGQNLQQNILPGIGGQATSFLGRGGSRQGIAEGLATQGAQRQFSQGAQNLLFQGAQQQQSAATAGIQGATQLGQLNLLPTLARFLPLQLAAGLVDPILESQAESSGFGFNIGGSGG